MFYAHGSARALDLCGGASRWKLLAQRLMTLFILCYLCPEAENNITTPEKKKLCFPTFPVQRIETMLIFKKKPQKPPVEAEQLQQRGSFHLAQS